VPDYLTLNDLPLRNKCVLLRADLNVPIQQGVVTDRSRLERLLPTLQDLAKANAKIVILSHCGRPHGRPDPQYSLRLVAKELENIWGQPIAFAEDCIGAFARRAVDLLMPGQILVLENVRFHPGEEANDPTFAKELASLGDVYINDAFSCAHRAHASTEGLAHILPSGAGRLMQGELEALAKVLNSPERPLAAVVGGSKISTKLDLLHNLITKVDIVILGGGMANTFVAAKGISIGRSLSEPSMYAMAADIMLKADSCGCHIILPKDAVVATELATGIATDVAPIEAIPADKMILDLGPASVKNIHDNLINCKTVVWNGPLGAFEIQPFDRATNEVAICIADLTKRGKILSVVGGGDTVAALSGAGDVFGYSYVSTAGGAFLEWLEGKVLPGVVALTKAAPKAKTGRVIL
jgi:phosphoglycerate kinase